MPDHAPLNAAALNVTLATPRLRLEPIAAHHAAPLFPTMTDPAVLAWISMTPPPDVASLAARWARIADAASEGRLLDGHLELGWAVQRVADGAWIGKMDASLRVDHVASNVGYLFATTAWGRGFATEAVVALCGHLARHGVVEQHATVTDGNDASCRVLERAGFKRERLLVGNDLLRGVPVDDIEYVRR